MSNRLLTSILIMLGTLPSFAQTHYKFDFGSATGKDGYQPVTATTVYTKERGYGFTNDANVTAVSRRGKHAIDPDFCTSDQPFYFSVDVPEGNYDVTLTLGDAEGTSSTLVRAESRRLVLDRVDTQAGQIVTRTFTVNVRHPRISDQESVRLKPRELSYLNWDGQLTLEFNGSAPKVCALILTRNDKAITVFLAGNSTVVDQDREPWAAWGQMIPRFFKPGVVAVSNQAESGETLKAFLAEKRFQKILSQLKAGDYVFIEFAHNDQKPGGNYLEPFTTYKEHLKLYIRDIRQRGGIPVLVTSMHRRNFDSTDHIVNTLGDYPEAVRQTAQEEQVALIDLNAMSKRLYEAWGPEASLNAFVHYPANTFPGQDKELKDNTHFSTYGAYELARCVVEGIKSGLPDLANQLVDGILPFNPAQPDSIKDWYWPLSPAVTAIKPDGN